MNTERKKEIKPESDLPPSNSFKTADRHTARMWIYTYRMMQRSLQ
jgi:hypothetical protein